MTRGRQAVASRAEHTHAYTADMPHEYRMQPRGSLAVGGYAGRVGPLPQLPGASAPTPWCLCPNSLVPLPQLPGASAPTPWGLCPNSLGPLPNSLVPLPQLPGASAQIPWGLCPTPWGLCPNSLGPPPQLPGASATPAPAHLQSTPATSCYKTWPALPWPALPCLTSHPDYPRYAASQLPR